MEQIRTEDLLVLNWKDGEWLHKKDVLELLARVTAPAPTAGAPTLAVAREACAALVHPPKAAPPQPQAQPSEAAPILEACTLVKVLSLEGNRTHLTLNMDNATWQKLRGYLVSPTPAPTAGAPTQAADDAHVTELDGGFFVMTESGRRLMSLSRGSRAIDKEPGVTAAEMEACAWALAYKLLQVDERAGGAGSQAPGALRWTKEKPTREGWYWVKLSSGIRTVEIVRKDYLDGDLRPDWPGTWAGWDRYDWAGPIPEPADEGPAGGAR